MNPGGESKGIAFFQQWKSKSRAASSSCCSLWAALASFPGHRVENAAALPNCSSSGSFLMAPPTHPSLWAGELGGGCQPRGMEQEGIASISPPGYGIPAGTASGDHPGVRTRRYRPLLPAVLSTGKITRALKQNARRQKRKCFKMILEDFLGSFL